MHRIFELSILKAGKKYYEELITKIDNYTDPYFLELAKLFPKDTSEIQRISSRVKQSIRLSLDFLNDRENSTPFEPFAVEQKFDLVVNVGAAYPIHLNGKIDRIDRNENGFLVIDYKSSEKQLQEKKVVIGTQLQLPTYLFLGNAHLNFGYPYGSYFFSLNPKSIPQPGFKHYQSALCAVEAFIEPKALLKSRRLIGWTLDKITIMDPPGTHTSNVYFYGEPRVRPEYDPDKVYLKMIQLYKDMVHGIKDGNISKHNLDRSCEFCDFEHFCHFSGEEEKINKVPAELSLIKEKGVE